jgi:hypothetical protein
MHSTGASWGKPQDRAIRLYLFCLGQKRITLYPLRCPASKTNFFRKEKRIFITGSLTAAEKTTAL